MVQHPQSAFSSMKHTSVTDRSAPSKVGLHTEHDVYKHSDLLVTSKRCCSMPHISALTEPTAVAAHSSRPYNATIATKAQFKCSNSCSILRRAAFLLPSCPSLEQVSTAVLGPCGFRTTSSCLVLLLCWQPCLC
jgi:hypothetical protein